MFSAAATDPTGPRAAPLALAVALIVACAPARAATPGASGPSYDSPVLSRDAALAAAAQGAQTLYLDIVMDGRVVRPLVRFRRERGRLWVAPDELRLAGLALAGNLPLDASGRVALDAIAGLQVQYDAAMQQVVLTPTRDLRQTQYLGYRRPEPVTARRDAGLALDWDVYARSFDGSQTLSLGTHARWFGRFGSLENTGVSQFGDGQGDSYRRLDTTWRYSDPVRMQSWAVGDLISGGLAWTRPVRMAGVQWRRNFGVRPDLITYPVPQFAADATVPSAIELYVNNVRQYSGEVTPGPFVLSDFPRVLGAGQAVVVVTDALGRTTRTSVPLYMDYERLAKGLSDFSFEAGVLRLGFGADTDEYGDDPVASASWRHGLRDDLTVELHGEAGPGLGLAGAGLAWSPLGRYGVVTASYAHSGGDRDGHQTAFGYQWYGRRAGFDLRSQRANADFRDLGALGNGAPPLRAQDRASLWWRVPRGSLSLNWLRYRDWQGLDGRTVSVGLSQSWRGLSLSANAFDDSRAGRGVSLSLSIPLGDTLDASLHTDHRRGHTDVAASLRRAAPYAGGWGWEVRARDDGDGQLSARWRGRAAEAWFGVDRIGGRTGGFAQGNGSLVWMDGQTFASRRIHDAFAVVSTNGVAGVPILFENRVAGVTDDDGYLLLAQLRGWQNNRVGIDPNALPANLDVPAIERLVTPVNNGGIRVEFELERQRAAIVLLHDAQGQPVAAGTRVRRADGGEAIVGFGGALYLEDYVDGEALRWSRAGVTCRATAPSLPAAASALPRLGPVRCQPRESP